METPRVGRQHSTGLVPARHRTEQAGQLMSSAVELAAGTPADNMDADSSGPSAVYGAVPLAIDLQETRPTVGAGSVPVIDARNAPTARQRRRGSADRPSAPACTRASSTPFAQ